MCGAVVALHAIRLGQPTLETELVQRFREDARTGYESVIELFNGAAAHGDLDAMMGVLRVPMF